MSFILVLSLFLYTIATTIVALYITVSLFGTQTFPLLSFSSVCSQQKLVQCDITTYNVFLQPPPIV